MTLRAQQHPTAEKRTIVARDLGDGILALTLPPLHAGNVPASVRAALDEAAATARVLVIDLADRSDAYDGPLELVLAKVARAVQRSGATAWIAYPDVEGLSTALVHLDARWIAARSHHDPITAVK